MYNIINSFLILLTHFSFCAIRFNMSYQEETMSYTKQLSLLLALALLLLVVVGCASDKPSSGTETQSQSSSEEETTAEVEEQPDLPNVNMDGREFVFIVRGPNYNEWQSQDIYVEEQTGEPIVDAVFARNVYLEEKYNMKIREYGASDVGNEARRSIVAGSADYDVVMANTTETSSLATQHLLYNLHDMPYLDLSRSWWDQRSVKQLSIANRLYFCTGDLSIMANDATWIIMFNKPMIDDNKLESPYDLVNENKWTIAKMLEMAKATVKDLDGDGKMRHDVDSYGFVTHESSCEGFFFGSGCNIVTKDEDDMPRLSMMNDRVLKVLEEAFPLIGDRDIVVNGSVQSLNAITQMQPIFESGRSLFYGEVMQCIIRLRAMEIDFGVIPFPKLDETQPTYNHFVHVTAAMISIPVTNLELDNTCIMLEAMAAKSKYTLQKAYYDICLEGKFMRDEESSAMLDIILDTRNFDIGYIYNWGNLFTHFRTTLTTGKGDFASRYAKAESSAYKLMEKTIEAWTEDA